MNRGDIKLVIDQLEHIQVDEQDYLTIGEAVTMLETLGNKVVEQAAVIEKLRDALLYSYENQSPLDECNRLIYIERALTIPTDSKQILKDWMREQLGEPISYLARPDTEDDYPLDYLVLAADPHPFIVQLTDAFPVYKLPECLNE